MRRVIFIGLSSGLWGTMACGKVAVDESPFGNPISDGMTSADPPADSSDGADPSTSSATSIDPTADASGPGLESSGGGPPMCGNGVREGDELCDGGDFGDISCESEGFTEGMLVCGDSCQAYSTEGCYICGNGVVEAAEGCDGGVGPGVSCESEGFTEGTIDCDLATCQLDTSGCSLCGNGVVEGAEPCDTDDLAGMSCADLGFDAGNLACDAAACSFDFSGCTGGNYFQDFEGGAAMPAEFGGGGNAVWVVDSSSPIAGVRSGASGVITHSQSSNLTLSVNYSVAGTVAFSHRESSEGSFDFLEFWIDGVMQQEWSGINATQLASYPVAAGAHTFEWRYTKDGSVNSGSDRVWVDDISLTGGAPV